MKLPKINFSRKNQLGWLIILSALTATMQYMVQGSMASGGSPAEFEPIFWQIDYALWGFRALIEAWVIIYCFSTQAKHWVQTMVLTIVEIALIALIFATLGPALRALTLRQPITEILSGDQLVWWTYGIAGYTSLMMAGVGFAYKLQPYDEAMIPVTELEALKAAAAAAGVELTNQAAALASELETVKTELVTAQAETTKRQSLLEQAQAFAQSLQTKVADLTTQLEQAATGVSQDVLANLQSKYDLAQAELGQLESELGHMSNKMAAKDAQLEQAGNLVKTLTGRLTNIGGEVNNWWQNSDLATRTHFLLDNLNGGPIPRPADIAAVLGVQPAQIFPIVTEWRQSVQTES